MNNCKNSTKRLEILKSILNEEEYKDFMDTVSNKQEEISSISRKPISNYGSALITEKKDIHLLNYVYRNIRYYLRKNEVYLPKLEEGIAIVVSKALVIDEVKNGGMDSYFTFGDRLHQRSLCNPFEEMARLLLCSVKREYVEVPLRQDEVGEVSVNKIKTDQKYFKEVLKLAISKDGLKNSIKRYCDVDFVESIETDLELSNISSDDISSATTKDARELIIYQLEKITELYHTGLGYKKIMTGINNQEIFDKLKTKFDNKVIYAKRNIGVYEKTKKLVKGSLN